MLKDDKMQATCSGTFMATMELPYAHMMNAWKEKWPLVEKEYAQEKLSQLLNRSPSLNFEPTIPHGKGKPLTGRKRKALNLTTRDPSQFVNVKASLRRKTQQDAVEDG
ncbi:hypothetical protein ACH5RR_032751 [Cinchona calisaya]|uniref:Uncharacterized protein n=1 Tax=Cinchona calisaya TaxID=153742 RepID=A0ABD2YN76_9GENT